MEAGLFALLVFLQRGFGSYFIVLKKVEAG
jgi:hypothetical protein